MISMVKFSEGNNSVKIKVELWFLFSAYLSDALCLYQVL